MDDDGAPRPESEPAPSSSSPAASAPAAPAPGMLGQARKAVWHVDTAPMTLVSPQLDPRAKYRRRRQFKIAQTAQLNEAVDTALRMGAVFLAGGAPTNDVEAAVFAAGTALGLEGFEVDITNRAITISVPPRGDRPGLTTLRVVRTAAKHHTRLVAAHELVVDLSAGRVTRDQMRERLAVIERMPRPYPRWFVTLAWGVVGGSLVIRLGGGWLAALIAFASAALVDRIGRVLSRNSAPQFFLNATGALIATSVAVLITASGIPADSSLVVAGGIIALLPGMALVVAAQEAMGAFPVTAAARFVELTVGTAGIVAGVLGGLLVAGQLGVTMAVADLPEGNLGSAVLAVVAAGVASAASAVGSHAPIRVLRAAGVAGAVGLVVVSLVGEWVSTAGAAEAVAATVVGALTFVMAARLRVPTVILVVPGILPMLPGLASYRGLLLLSEGNVPEGTAVLLGAATVALALAAGVLLGELVAQAVARRRMADRGAGAGPATIVGSLGPVAPAGEGPTTARTTTTPAARPDGTSVLPVAGAAAPRPAASPASGGSPSETRLARLRRTAAPTPRPAAPAPSSPAATSSSSEPKPVPAPRPSTPAPTPAPRSGDRSCRGEGATRSPGTPGPAKPPR